MGILLVLISGAVKIDTNDSAAEGKLVSVSGPCWPEVDRARTIMESFISHPNRASERSETGSNTLNISQIQLLTDSLFSQICESLNEEHYEGISKRSSPKNDHTYSTKQDNLAQINSCPDSNEYTVDLLERVLMEEKYQGFRMETGIQQVNINEIITLADVNNSSECAAIRQQGGFDFPKPDISTTYFKSGNLYIAVEHFTDTILREEGGMIEVTTGPVGAIGVLDTNFNIIKSDFIW